MSYHDPIHYHQGAPCRDQTCAKAHPPREPKPGTSPCPVEGCDRILASDMVVVGYLLGGQTFVSALWVEANGGREQLERMNFHVTEVYAIKGEIQ